MPNLQGYIFYSLQHFTTKLHNFSKHGMLFQAMVIFLLILNFFQISCKGGKVHCMLLFCPFLLNKSRLIFIMNGLHDRRYLLCLFILRNVNKNNLSFQIEFPQVLEIAKRALDKGELDIAEKSIALAIKTEKLTCNETSAQPYLYLAEIHEKRSEKSVKILEKQRLLLKAAALYNFVLNCVKTTGLQEEEVNEIRKTVYRKLHDIQDSLVLSAGGNPINCSFDSGNKRKELEQLRQKIKDRLRGIDFQELRNKNTPTTELDYRELFVEQIAQVKDLCESTSAGIKNFLAAIIKECIQVLGEPPCDHEVIVLGSLARDEVTPYSDFEWAILTSSDEEECKVFYRNLTNLVHLQVGKHIHGCS